MNPLSSQNHARSADRQRLPLALIAILIVLGVGIASMLWNITEPEAVVGTFYLSGTAAIGYLIAGLLIQGLAFLGILKRREWGRKIGMVWEAYRLVVSIMLIRAAIVDREGLLAAYDRMTPGFRVTADASEFMFPGMVLGAIIMMVVSATIILYLAFNRKQFHA